MEYVISLIFALCFLTGCVTGDPPVLNTDAPKVYVPAETTANLKETGFAVLDGLLWGYDTGSVFFEEETIVINGYADASNPENGAAPLETGYRVNAAVMYVDLRHYDYSTAGKARFYFYNDEIVRSGYAPPGNEDAFVSLREKNLFEMKNPYDATENRAIKYPAPAVVSNGVFPGGAAAGHSKSSDGFIAVVDGEWLRFYEYVPAKGFITAGAFTYGGLAPVDFAFMSGGKCAVILGAKDTDAGENDGYMRNTAELISKRIVILNKSLDVEYTGDMDEGFTAAATMDGSLVLCRGNALEFYNYTGGTLIKRSQAILPHWAESAVSGVVAGDIEDLLVSDGRDLYLYRIEGGIPELVWRTRYGLSTVGRAYLCDINGDGVSEIYVTDGTRTCLRYYLAEFGFKAETAHDAAGLYMFGQFGESGWALIPNADGL